MLPDEFKDMLGLSDDGRWRSPLFSLLTELRAYENCFHPEFQWQEVVAPERPTTIIQGMPFGLGIPVRHTKQLHKYNGMVFGRESIEREFLFGDLGVVHRSVYGGGAVPLAFGEYRSNPIVLCGTNMFRTLRTTRTLRLLDSRKAYGLDLYEIQGEVGPVAYAVWNPLVGKDFAFVVDLAHCRIRHYGSAIALQLMHDTVRYGGAEA